MKILHVITGLNNGGAEAVLFRLITSTLHEVSHTVVSMLDEGVYGPRLTELGVRVDTLKLSRNPLSLLMVGPLSRIIKEQRPDLVQTWMYHADLLGGLAARVAGCRNVVWGIRHSSLHGDKRSTRAVAGICAFLARRIPAAIACCSENAARLHQEMGYPSGLFHIIPNGYDLSRFAPNQTARDALRLKWGVRPNELLFGLVGRWNQQKDHANLLHALFLLAEKGVCFRCVLVGPGMNAANDELSALIRQYQLTDRIIQLGPRSDISGVMNALDLHILSSKGEAFPNVVAEAMACGTPCVATDVGDAALIVGNDAWVVPPGNPEMLAQAIACVLDSLEREGAKILGAQCRERIVENFNLKRMAVSYRSLWGKVISGSSQSELVLFPKGKA